MTRVLIAEDEMLVRLGLRNSIQWNRFNMTVIADVSNGLEALEYYERDKPDLIITDLKMPVMDGMQLIEKIRSKDQETKFIILTCVEEFEMVHKAIRYGVSDYILKLTMTPEDMENVLSKISADMNRDQKQLTANPSINEGVVFEKLIKDYMFRQLYSSEELKRLLRKLGRVIPEQKLILLLLEMDQYDRLQQRFKDFKGDLIKASLLNVLNEIIRGYHRGEVFHDEHKRFVILLSFHDVTSEQKQNQLITEMTDHILRVMKSFFNVTVTFGISSMRNGFQSLLSQYNEGISALEDRFFLGPEFILYKQQEVTKHRKEQVAEYMRQILACGYDLKNEALRLQMKSKVDYFLQMDTLYTKSNLIRFIVQMMQLPIALFHLIHKKIFDLNMTNHDKLERCSSLQEAVQIYTEYMKGVMQHYHSRRQYGKEVTEAIEYIHQCFHQDISLKQIADKVSMSANHLSTLFNKETGQSVVDYIQLLRVEQARAMLTETHLKSYEVADKVGFSDHSYFSRVFKKVTGVGPRQYRRRWLQDEEGSEEDD